MSYTILLHITKEDERYLPRLKSILHGRAKVYLTEIIPDTVYELVLAARQKGTTCVATTSLKLLKLLIPEVKHQVTLDNYAGSIIEKHGVEFLILNPLDHLFTVAHAEFLFVRYFNKFLKPEMWLQIPEFKWELFDPAKTDELIDLASSSDFIGVDLETGKEEDRVITCISFSCVVLSVANYSVTTFVVPFTDEYNIAFTKVICQLPVGKIFQNGKYDNAYLLRYGIPVSNWEGDTAHLFHSWYSELPKRLDFIVSFTLRRWQYWKAESSSQDIMEYYAYNAKDSFVTALCWIALLKEVPDWGWINYYQEFPLVFPCLLTELTGLKRDQEYAAREEARYTETLSERLKKLRVLLNSPTFNPSSPQQTIKLFAALGSGDITSSDVQHRDKVAFRHPLNALLMEEIKGYREDRKLATTYLRDKDEKSDRTKTWNGRIFYSLNPHYTDTGRLSSRESAFWCGWNIQNFTRDRDDIRIRGTVISDDGFYFGEADYSQNETWNTAYLSGDKALIATIENRTKDFHGTNASLFFGVSYDSIVHSEFDNELEEWTHKTLDKVLRNDIGKRINHGANYNMGPQVLMDTMGLKNVVRARNYLKLPSQWSLLKVCQHLLNLFDKTYPGVRTGAWYDKIRSDVRGTQMLIGPTNWTRYCFGNPTANKRDLNRYAAHHPQSLAAMRLNIAYLRVFYNIALPNPKDFKLGPQIHDSILFQYRIGRTDLIVAVADCMKIITPVKDVFGTVRQLDVPVDIKGESNRWSELKTLRLKQLRNSLAA